MKKLPPLFLKTLFGHLESYADSKSHVALIADFAKGKIIASQPKYIPLGTPFQNKVLKEVCKIPYGQTMTYSQIAATVGKPKAVRAAASAIARNNIPIIIPCHRVTRSDGTIGQYRWGAKLKEQLLDFERKTLMDQSAGPQTRAKLLSSVIPVIANNIGDRNTLLLSSRLSR